MANVIRGVLQLMRPPNLPTAAADILAGATIAGYFSGTSNWSLLFYLIGGSVLLYAGGVVLNDVFDLEVDRSERPERPIPSGTVSPRLAAFIGGGLLLSGILLSFLAGTISGIIAFVLAILILLYDGLAKNHKFFGPLTMGLCRGMNLVLGMSVFGFVEYPWIAIVPVIYIFAITLVSRGEVHGENRAHILWAGFLYAVVLASLLVFGSMGEEYPYYLILAVIVFANLILRPLIKAYRDNSPGNIMKAVKAGVMSLVVMDACLAMAFGPLWAGLVILCLWPVSYGLAKLFAVT